MYAGNFAAWLLSNVVDPHLVGTALGNKFLTTSSSKHKHFLDLRKNVRGPSALF